MRTSTQPEPPFLKVYLPALESLAEEPSLPAYHRVHLLALAHAKPNGHAEFGRGALAVLVGQDGKRHHDIDSVIKQAIARKLLDSTSVSKCLVLPENLAAPHDKFGRAKHLPCQTHRGTPPPTRVAECHPHRKHKAHTLCDSCYKTESRLAKVQNREPAWLSPSVPVELAEVGENGGEFQA